jgi:UMF1 family MFS transporter
LLTKLVPEHKHAEFFGLYSFSGKISSLFGPLVYGIVVGRTENHRLAMASIIAFFVVGLAVLTTVREAEGIELAQVANV